MVKDLSKKFNNPTPKAEPIKQNNLVQSQEKLQDSLNNQKNITNKEKDKKQNLLDFVYTDFDAVPSDDPEFLCNILVMADQLLIPRLVQICEKQLASLLTLKNVGEILQLSCEFNAEQLRKCCMDFVCPVKTVPTCVQYTVKT